jgi:hypothetical protein
MWCFGGDVVDQDRYITKKVMVFIWSVQFNYPLRPSSPNAASHSTSGIIDRKSSTLSTL